MVKILSLNPNQTGNGRDSRSRLGWPWSRFLSVQSEGKGPVYQSIEVIGAFRVPSSGIGFICDARQVPANPLFHERTKHIENYCYFIRQHLVRDTVRLLSLTSADHTLLIYWLTKAHLPGCFLYLVGKVKRTGNFLHWTLKSHLSPADRGDVLAGIEPYPVTGIHNESPLAVCPVSNCVK